MLLNTHRLFANLLPGLRIDAVCDVGSMDGADSVRFSKTTPRSRIYAFEPNPFNYSLMDLRREYFKERGISLIPLAATNCDGVSEFFLVEANYSQRDARRGMSSLHRREAGEWAATATVAVRTTRLETFIAGNCSPGARIALWIDVEGAAFEVIEGLGGAAQQVHLVHVEVETVPCIGKKQKLYREVKGLLGGLGFIELATDRTRRSEQFNALFVRSGVRGWMQPRVLLLSGRARLRFLIGHFIRRACPACARFYQRLRSRSA